MCLQDFVILLVDFITLGVSKDPRYRGPARECQVVYRGNGGRTILFEISDSAKFMYVA